MCNDFEYTIHDLWSQLIFNFLKITILYGKSTLYNSGHFSHKLGYWLPWLSCWWNHSHFTCNCCNCCNPTGDPGWKSDIKQMN